MNAQPQQNILSNVSYLYPEISQTKIGDGAFEKLISRYHQLVKKLDEYDEEKKKCSDEIKAIVGDLEEYKGKGYSLTYRWQKGHTTINTKLLQEKFLKAYTACAKTGEETTVLRINFK